MERPVGVTILAVLYFIGGGFAALCGILLIVGGSMLSGLAHAGGAGTGSALLAMGGAVLGAICLGIAVLDLAIGIGFIKLQNWARIVAIIFLALGLVLYVFALLGALTHMIIGILIFRTIIAAIQVWILVYLFKPHVKQAFGATSF